MKVSPMARSCVAPARVDKHTFLHTGNAHAAPARRPPCETVTWVSRAKSDRAHPRGLSGVQKMLRHLRLRAEKAEAEVERLQVQPPAVAAQGGRTLAARTPEHSVGGTPTDPWPRADRIRRESRRQDNAAQPVSRRAGGLFPPPPPPAGTAVRQETHGLHRGALPHMLTWAVNAGRSHLCVRWVVVLVGAAERPHRLGRCGPAAAAGPDQAGLRRHLQGESFCAGWLHCVP